MKKKIEGGTNRKIFPWGAITDPCFYLALLKLYSYVHHPFFPEPYRDESAVRVKRLLRQRVQRIPTAAGLLPGLASDAEVLEAKVSWLPIAELLVKRLRLQPFLNQQRLQR